MNLHEMFEKHKDKDFLKFERVTPKRSKRRDVHAFLLLDEIVPPEPTRGYPDRLDESCDMVSAAEHDEIWLSVDAEALAAKATEEQILELVRCGIRYDRDNDALCMFA